MISHPRFITLIFYAREGEKASFAPRQCGPFLAAAAAERPGLWTGGGWQLIFVRSENGGHSHSVNGLQDDPDSAVNETDLKKANHKPKLKQV